MNVVNCCIVAQMKCNFSKDNPPSSCLQMLMEIINGTKIDGLTQYIMAAILMYLQSDIKGLKSYKIDLILTLEQKYCNIWEQYLNLF